MKKTTLLLFLLLTSVGFSQQKTTGLLNLSSNTTATLMLDSPSQIVTLTLTGPNDRWFALQYGSFNGGMELGADLVYWNNVTLVDADHNGIGASPTNDITNNWVLVSNTNNSPSTGLRTLVYTRAFNTGDATDYVFNFANNDIDLAWAKMDSASFTMAYHGNNRAVLLNTPLTTLGVDDLTLNATQIYPNPSRGIFTVQSKTTLDKISVYSQTGVLVKTIEIVNNSSETIEVNLLGLQTGVYLLELQNATEKSWKKIIVD